MFMDVSKEPYLRVTMSLAFNLEGNVLLTQWRRPRIMCMALPQIAQMLGREEFGV